MQRGRRGEEDFRERLPHGFLFLHLFCLVLVYPVTFYIAGFLCLSILCAPVPAEDPDSALLDFFLATCLVRERNRGKGSTA